MGCTVTKKDRAEYCQQVVLEYFQGLAPDGMIVTLETSLGPWGLGHLPAKRKLYFSGIKQLIAKKGCGFKSLNPNKFADASLKTVGAVAALIEKDLA